MVSKISDQLPSNEEMVGMMWDLTDHPRDVEKDTISRYCRVIVRALLESDVDALNVLSENLELPATPIKYNGWIEADTLKRIVAEGLIQLVSNDS